jgi:hypothetical protein
MRSPETTQEVAAPEMLRVREPDRYSVPLLKSGSRRP